MEHEDTVRELTSSVKDSADPIGSKVRCKVAGHRLCEACAHAHSQNVINETTGTQKVQQEQVL